MLSFIIDVMEVQDIVTAEIPGAFLKTYYKKGDIRINMEREMVNLLEEIDSTQWMYFI